MQLDQDHSEMAPAWLYPYAVMEMKMKMSDSITYLLICHTEAPPIVVSFEGGSKCIDHIA